MGESCFAAPGRFRGPLRRQSGQLVVERILRGHLRRLVAFSRGARQSCLLRNSRCPPLRSPSLFSLLSLLLVASPISWVHFKTRATVRGHAQKARDHVFALAIHARPVRVSPRPRTRPKLPKPLLLVTGKSHYVTVSTY